MFNSFRINFVRKNSTWLKPQGYDTGIKIYNCVAKENVPLITKQKGIISWYTCGPTVYDEAHIGHASCYLKIDIIQRILSNYFNFNLITVMNITDIDDKIIKRAKELNKPFNEISKFYEKEFWNDLEKLNINKPNLILRVSENIPCIENFISSLLKQEKAYKTEDGSVNFDIKNLSNYGKLVNISRNVDNEDIDVNKKDCTLWKSSKPDEPFWKSPWGTGRPGWHVECSALASEVFGSSIDIHAGGMDLKFPHHENEEAHSCSYHSCAQWVNYWVHIGQLHSKSSEKMSKSLKNTISISSLLERTKPDEFRLACLMSHYRSRMEYSEELLKMTGRTLKKYRNFINNCTEYITTNRGAHLEEGSVKYLLLESREELHEALCNDFDTPEVINILNKIVRTINPLFSSNSVSISTVIGLKNFVIQVLNLFNISESGEIQSTSDTVDMGVLSILKEFRKNVRGAALDKKDKNLLKFCDEVRTELESKGIEVKDTNKHSIVSS